MPVLPDALKDMLNFASFVSAAKEAAKDAGTACNMPQCDSLTLGQRCTNCSRRVCVGHAFWNLSGAKARVFCVYCAVAACGSCFADDDDDDANDAGDQG
jgi:hypothetical protein